MAQSRTDAANSALQKLGAVRIMNIDTDTSREARQCRIAFDDNRRSELRKHRWNFAIKRAQLSPDTDVPAFGFSYQYTLPADCLRVLRPVDPTCDWVIEGRSILTNYGGALNLRYIADIEDLSLWDSAFYDMFAISLAYDLCETITNSTSKRQMLDKDYNDALKEARRNNAFEKGALDGPDDSFWLVRL